MSQSSLIVLSVILAVVIVGVLAAALIRIRLGLESISRNPRRSRVRWKV